MSNPKGKKVPQDHKPKKGAIGRLRDEASQIPGIDEMAGISLTVSGRMGEVTVETLPNFLDWDAEVMSFLGAGDYLSAICGMIPVEEAARLRAIRPTIGSLMAALMEPAGNGEAPGESQAS